MNTSTKKHVSKCMFCNSPSYGFGCPYSPHKKHVHVDDPRKCIYCGSVSIGKGCPYNPFSKLHVRGIEYNTMLKESIYHSVMTGLFLSRLTEPITEMYAYKLGLINEKGDIIKESQTPKDKAALTPLDLHIIKIRRMIGEDVISLFKSKTLLELSTQKEQKQFNPQEYEQEIKLKAATEQILQNMYELFSDAIEKGFSRSCIENLLIEAIIKSNEHHENNE